MKHRNRADTALELRASRCAGLIYPATSETKGAVFRIVANYKAQAKGGNNQLTIPDYAYPLPAFKGLPYLYDIKT